MRVYVFQEGRTKVKAYDIETTGREGWRCRDILSACPLYNEDMFVARFKAKCPSYDTDYVWMDVGYDEEAPVFDGSIIIKVSKLKVGLLDEDDVIVDDVFNISHTRWKELHYDTGLCKGIDNIVYNSRDEVQGKERREDRDGAGSIQTIQHQREHSGLKHGAGGVGSSIVGTAVKTKHVVRPLAEATVQATKSFGSFLANTAAYLLETGQLPSETAAISLNKLVALQSTKVDSKKEEHVFLFQRLWISSFGSNSGFSLNDVKWTELGFQRKDPTSDFRGCGQLALECLVYLSEIYNSQWMALLQTKRKGDKMYPLAVTCINISFMLSNILKLHDRKFMTSPENYWEAFRDEATFYKLFSVSVLLFNHVWTFYDAGTIEFERMMDSTRDLVVDVLGQGCTTCDQLLYNFSERGLLKM